MIDLKGKAAIVTGASSGIGRAAAKLFARAGAKLVVAARRKAELESLVGEIADQGGSALAVAGDVSDEMFAKELVERAEESYGHLDVAFNNAGILGEKGPTTGISLEGWNEALKVNLTSAFVGYTVGFPNVAAYAASKSGLIGLTQVLAAEYGPQNIRVNAILPGAVETAMYEVANETAEEKAYLTNLHALKRIASPDELAQAALYLASDASSFQSGTAMLVDGGLSITRT
jgi:NAD(P)-dependent dehydrogenase (short-subunit alcohol dehydrogenase family)